MEVTMKEAEKLVPVSRTTLYNDKKAGTFSVKKNAKGRTVIDVAELQRVYGDLNTNIKQSSSVQSDKPELSKPANTDGSSTAIEIKYLKEKVRQIEEQSTDTIETLKDALKRSQDGHNTLETRLLEDQRTKESGAGEWEKSLKILEQRIANQEAKEKEHQEREEKLLKQARHFKKALQEEKNKGFFQKLFG